MELKGVEMKGDYLDVKEFDVNGKSWEQNGVGKGLCA